MSPRHLAAFSLLLAAPLASAQTVYKWVDEDGNTHYSQTLPPEQVERDHDRLTGDGLIAERIARAPTAEERAALAEQMRQARDEAERKRLQDQQDRLFLAAFPTESDIVRAMDSRRETVLNERRTVESLIEQNRAGFGDMVQQAAAYERQGQAVPPWLTEAISSDRGKLRELTARLEEIDQRLADLEAEREAELARHRQLTGGPG